MAMVSMMVGGVTDARARFTTKVDNGPVRIAYSVNADMSSPSFSASESVDAQGVANVEVTGLTADTRYHWQVEDDGVLDTSATGQLLTDPTAGSQASFTLALAGDAGQRPMFPGSGPELRTNRISNHPVFDTIRQRALAEGWRRFVHLGDLTYYDIGDAISGTFANYRTMWDDVLSQSRQHRLYRELAWAYVWDDHDYDGNNSDGTYANKDAAQGVWRRRMAHYDLDDTEAIYQNFIIGRVLFILWDVRSYRSPNGATDDASKTILGSAQKTWMDNLLATTSAQFLVVISPSQWLGTQPGGDGWNSFTTERDELINLFDTRGFLDKMCIVGADVHYLGIDTGTNDDGGGIPVFQFAPLDSDPSDVAPNRYDEGQTVAARGQYGTLRVDDLGDQIVVTGTGWRGERAIMWHTLTTGATTTVHAGNPSHVLAL